MNPRRRVRILIYSLLSLTWAAFAPAQLFEYNAIAEFHEGLAVVTLNGKRGFIDETGREVIAPRYEDAGIFSEGLAAVKQDGKWGYIDKQGREVIPLLYDGARNFREKLAAVRLEGKWGYIDPTGRMAIPPAHGRAFDFSQGLARVGEAGLFGFIGFIDREGNVVIPMQYVDARDISEGYAAVNASKFGEVDKWRHIDKTGKFRSTIEAMRLTSVRNGVFVYALGKQDILGFIAPEWKIGNVQQLDTDAATMFQPIVDDGFYAYSHISDFRNGYAIAQTDFAHGASVGIQAVAKARGVESASKPRPAGSNVYWLINEKGVQVTAAFDGMRQAQNGFVAVLLNGRWGVVDLTDPIDDQTANMPVPAQFPAITSVNAAGFAYVQVAARQWRRVNVPAQKPLRNGVLAAQGGKHQLAAELFRQAAELGEPAAMGNLGYLYAHGLGVSRNLGHAQEWLTKGAEGGDAHSMMNLADMLYRANQRDAAVTWLRQAEALGHPQARPALDQISRRPAQPAAVATGAPAPAVNANEAARKAMAATTAKDFVEAAKWFRVAAEQGHVSSMLFLGNILYYGREGVEKNEAEGREWIRKAADGGSVPAKRVLEKIDER